MEVFSLEGLFDRKQKTYWNSVNPFLLFEYQNNNDFSIHSLLLKPIPLTKICIQSRRYYNKQTYGKDRLQKSRETNERGWARTINLQNFVRLIYRGILKGVPQIKLNMKRSLLGGLGSIYKIRNLLSLFFSSCPREKISRWKTDPAMPLLCFYDICNSVHLAAIQRTEATRPRYFPCCEINVFQRPSSFRSNVYKLQCRNRRHCNFCWVDGDQGEYFQ